MEALARYLKENKKTQRWLAAAVGVRNATVSSWMRDGTVPRPAHIQRIAEVTDGAVPVTAWFTPHPMAAE